MRNCGPPKQRVWMGPGRHIRGCERRITHANAYSYSDAHSYTDRHGYSDSHRYSFRYTDAETDAYAQV